MPTAEELISAASIRRLGEILRAVAPQESDWRTVTASSRRLGPLALGERARTVAAAILADLPGGYRPLAAVVRSALGEPELTGWMIWPVTEAVATAATASEQPADFADGLALLAALTPRLTGEFALRTFLNADLGRTLGIVREWTGDPDPAVRRLATEGTRPKLPWAKQVPGLNREPGRTVPILDLLHKDADEAVRRSVANHLNDLSRLAPELAVATAERWLKDPDGATRGLVRHAMRTLVKKGDPAALGLVGFRGERDALAVTGPEPAAREITVGDELVFTAAIRNTSAEPVVLAVDYVIHYQKANGSLAPKVFKLAKRTLAPGESVELVRRHSFRPITTRVYHPGPHALELQVNGHRFGRAGFVLHTTDRAAG
ncbi:DNA alkylation repair protein [Streptomyces sp. NBC_01476]|uniref:DNA alkylation repair protein n=1 Tax=Streptomyces sp. NBC_01476 TaxID=2903881 RepID=UPI002E352150|nr:DNA alkylation repair protein [Streptomyces sp. NBC_01476]